MAKTISDNSIHQLSTIATQQQNSINSIQATLAYHQTILDAQQKNIDDIKTTLANNGNSINHIIHCLSDLATKLGFQITLPPPLPLSPTTPTLLPATVVVPPATSFVPNHLQSQPPNDAPKTISHPLVLVDLVTDPSDVARLETAVQTNVEVGLKGVGKFRKGSGVLLFQVLDMRPAINLTWLSEQKWTDACNMFVEMTKPSELSFQLAIIINNNTHLTTHLLNPNVTFASSQYLNESKPLIFDPGGKMDFGSLFVMLMSSERKLQQGFKKRVMWTKHLMKWPNYNAWSMAVGVTVLLNKQIGVIKITFLPTCLIFLKEANSCQEQIFILCCQCHNYASTAPMLLPLAYDLEDKVDFEGTVMIRQ